MARRHLVPLAIAAVLAGFGGQRLVGQGAGPQTSGASGTELGQLLAEVRGLRADLRDTAATSARMQVLLARIQLQEQRIVHLDQERSTVTAKRLETERVIATMAGGVKQFEDLVARDQMPRDIATAQQAGIQAQLRQLQQTQAQLVAQENELLGSIAGEQARWSDFNAQLDALDSTLSRPR